MAKIYAIVGMSGTGKSATVDFLKKKGYNDIYFGGYILKETKNRGLEITPSNEKFVREDMRKQKGVTAILQLALPDIRKLHNQGKDIILDGLYTFSSYILLKEEFTTNLVVVAIHSPKRLRYKRLEQRDFRPLTQEEVDQRDVAEIQNLEKGGPIAVADIHIVNDGTLKSLYAKLEKSLS